MEIHRNRTYLVQPVRHILVARDATDAQSDAERRYGKSVTTDRLDTRSPTALCAPVHYTPAAQSFSARLDIYA